MYTDAPTNVYGRTYKCIRKKGEKTELIICRLKSYNRARKTYKIIKIIKIISTCGGLFADSRPAHYI